MKIEHVSKVMIELTDEQAFALWNWSQTHDVKYWEVPGLAQVVNQVKLWYLYESPIGPKES